MHTKRQRCRAVGTRIGKLSTGAIADDHSIAPVRLILHSAVALSGAAAATRLCSLAHACPRHASANAKAEGPQYGQETVTTLLVYLVRHRGYMALRVKVQRQWWGLAVNFGDGGCRGSRTGMRSLALALARCVATTTDLTHLQQWMAPLLGGSC